MITAIVSVFNPDSSNKENVEKIAKQVDKVILCDNSVQSNELLFDGISNCKYMPFYDNLGLSVAFNRALKSDNIWNDQDFVIFFDQDSSIKEGHVATLKKEYDSLVKQGKYVGCLGPVFFNTRREKIETPHIKQNVSERTFQVKSIINSSLLAQYGVLKSVGFFNEEMFLDYVDWDLCFRLIKSGFAVYMTRAVVLTHDLGIGDKNLGLVKIRIGREIREYYETRDALYLLKKDYVPSRYCYKLLFNVYLRPIVHYFTLDNKKERMEYVKQGKKDYKMNIHGQYQSK